MTKSVFVQIADDAEVDVLDKRAAGSGCRRTAGAWQSCWIPVRGSGHCDRRAHPRARRWEIRTSWVGVGRAFRQQQEIFERLQAVIQVLEISSPGGDEAGEFCQLRHADGGLHVGQLQVVADVGVGVFVIVAAGQIAQLPIEALAAGVVFSRLAPAVAAPVAEGFDERFQQRRVGERPRRPRPW